MDKLAKQYLGRHLMKLEGGGKGRMLHLRNMTNKWSFEKLLVSTASFKHWINLQQS